MKYTRYDLKKEKGTKNFVLMIALVLIAAFIIGTVASKIIMDYYNVSEPTPASTQQTVKNNSNKSNNTVSNDKNNAASNTGNKKSSADGSQVKFVAVQGGIYKDKKMWLQKKIYSCSMEHLLKFRKMIKLEFFWEYMEIIQQKISWHHLRNKRWIIPIWILQ
jgi:hypothetical protein